MAQTAENLMNHCYRDSQYLPLLYLASLPECLTSSNRIYVGITLGKGISRQSNILKINETPRFSRPDILTRDLLLRQPHYVTGGS